MAQLKEGSVIKKSTGDDILRKVYESIPPTPHAWSPADYPQAWQLIE